MTFHIPVIDISPYVGAGSADERAAVARAVDEAACTVGFMQITGHGVSDPVLEKFAAAMDSFFALNLEAKKAYRTPPEINRGYSPPKSESLSLSLGVTSANRMNDFFEAFNIGAAASDYPGVDLPATDYAENLWPQQTPGLPRTRTSVFRRGDTSVPHPHHRLRRRPGPTARLFRRLRQPLARRIAHEQLCAPAGNRRPGRRLGGNGGAHRLRHRDRTVGRSSPRPRSSAPRTTGTTSSPPTTPS